jgi:hypothetical protein
MTIRGSNPAEPSRTILLPRKNNTSFLEGSSSSGILNRRVVEKTRIGRAKIDRATFRVKTIWKGIAHGIDPAAGPHASFEDCDIVASLD